MPTKTYNKIIYGGQTLIDLTADTVDDTHLLSGVTAHDKSGAIITGSCTYDSDTQDATAAVAEILNTKTAYVRGVKITGTMPNRGKVTGTLSTKSGTYTIQQGYHDGSGTVGIATSEQAKLIPENIREGITILGVEGSMNGSEDEHPETGKEVIPTTTDQIISPADGNTCFREVTVKAIPYAESPNAAGGTTVTIG